MNDGSIRNREGKIIGRFDGNWPRDGNGKLLACYGEKSDIQIRELSDLAHKYETLGFKARCALWNRSPSREPSKLNNLCWPDRIWPAHN
jgi:hypothetical protein